MYARGILFGKMKYELGMFWMQMIESTLTDYEKAIILSFGVLKITLWPI